MFSTDVQHSQTCILAGIPYSSISDSTITVSNDDIKKLYEEKKESFKQPVETRDIKFIECNALCLQKQTVRKFRKK